MSMPGSYRLGGVVAEVHMKLQQWTHIGTNVTAVVEFNTKYQTSVLGAALWQFYANFSGSLATASLKSNTIVAPPKGGANVLSYPLHGGPVGSGTLCDNYFFGVSERGMFGAMYSRSLTKAQGWTGSCPSGKPGVNMTNGAPINPK